jgi:phosphocarrier protein HPr
MTKVVEKDFDVINALGLHARAAAQLVKVANRFKSDVSVTCEGQTVNGKSIMGVLMLAAAQGMRVHIRAEGDDSEECLQALGELFSQRFGEPR